jgi:dienelactone hydrolase
LSDTLDLYDWLASQPGVDPSRLAVIGRSLGTGLAAFLVAHRQVAAVVLITPYDSILEIARQRFPFAPVRLLLRHRFESVRFARAARAPVLVLIAERDSVIPHEHTYRLIDAWAGDKYVVRILGSDHSDIQLNPQSWRAVQEFLCSRVGRAVAKQSERRTAVAIPPLSVDCPENR